jgi:hypothetical protein
MIQLMTHNHREINLKNELRVNVLAERAYQ